MKITRTLCCPLALLLMFWGCSDDGQISRDLGGDLQRPDSYKYKQDTGYVPPDGGVDTFVKKDTVKPPDHGPRKPDQGSGTPITAPFTLSFDQNKGNMTGTKDWEWGKIAFVKGTNCDSTPTAPKSGNSGMGVWGTKLNDCYTGLGNNAKEGSGTCNNVNPNDDSILSLKAKIPSTFTLASLIFYQWTDIFYYFDWHEIRIIEGTNVNVIRKYCLKDHTAPTKWVKETIYLDKYIGKTITIQFHFMASKSVNYAGWYLDDVSIQNK